MAAVTTEKQREQFLGQVNAAEDWLYDAGENAPASEHQCVLQHASCSCRMASPGVCQL